jgi:histidine triad (HIT) family protein
MTAESSCLFCRLQRGEIPATIVFEDDALVAFRDINPRAPTHILLIPRRHVASTTDLAESDDALTGRLVRTAATLAAQQGLTERGYRLVLNSGPDAGQTVFHIHLHLLGGREMGWPPG